MERVSIIPGKHPVLVVAPHGYEGDDEKTAHITEYIAKNFGFYAVLNRGWERDETVDFMQDKADCNNVLHVHEDVVKEEILDPIMRYKSKILTNHHTMYLYYIHGMSNKHRIMANDPGLDVVVGYGAGSPDSYTCEIWRKNLFLHLLNESGMVGYEGAKGGAMSGWSRSNMNQLFRKWYPDVCVQSMQIEIVHELRADKDIASVTADYLGNCMKDMLAARKFDTPRVFSAY